MGDTFADETTPTAVGGGRYEATINSAWSLRPLPHGGLVTALAVRAMTDLLDDPRQQLRTLHTTFVAQVAAGAVTIDAELLRRGRSMSHLRAEVTNVDAPRGHLTTAVFGSPRDGFSFTDLPKPEGLPAPDDCRSGRDPWPEGIVGAFDGPMPFWAERVESRSALGHMWWDEYVPAGSARAAWYRFDDPPMRDDGTMDPLALVVLADTMPGAAGEKLGSTDRVWFAPSIDLTVHILDECRSPWVLGYNTARFAGDGYASADMALWDCGPEGRDAPRLVAYATQLFLFSFLS